MMNTGKTFVEISTNRNSWMRTAIANTILLGSMIGMSFDAPKDTMLMVSTIDLVGIGTLGYTIKETIKEQKTLTKLRNQEKEFFKSLKNRRQ